jgi:adenosine deaminase
MSLQPAALPPETVDLLARMPKAELHLHLDGSLRPGTALEIARAKRLDEGMDLAAMRGRLVGPPRTRSQAELLRYFDLPIALMQDADALERITRELVEDVASDGTRYVEIRWAPSLHTADGMPLGEGIEAVVRGAEEAAAEQGIVVRLIAVALRSHPPRISTEVARKAAAYIDRGLVGFDLAGQEEAHPDPLVHLEAFETAREAGLGITIHAGEWGGAVQVQRALGVNPSRIAHGALADANPSVVGALIERDVCLDLCPTSNVQAGVVPTLTAHPLSRLLRRGVPVTLNTDDRTVSDLSLPREYANAITEMGVTLPEIWSMVLRALRVAFLHHDELLRARLLQEFDAWAAEEPALRTGGSAAD